MANWEWPSEEDKFEAIGYLAVPGVINSIEATVPKGKTNQFRKDYKGRFSDEYPYEADKYGKQFRIYLNDTEGCPSFLRSHLDGAYGNRINNTQFIDELVLEYGFKFTKEPQNSELIRQSVFGKCSVKQLDGFIKGFNSYRDFVQKIEKLVKTENGLTGPQKLEYVEKTVSRKSEGKAGRREDGGSGFTPNQMLKLGWIGEEYVCYLLKAKDAALLESLGIPAGMNYEVEWFNLGFQDAEEEYIFTDIDHKTSEFVKKWEDQSVGKGCDLRVFMDSGETIYIEVKTSKRSYPYFNMTSAEMQEMEKQGSDYVLLKVNNIERLLENKAPEIIAIRDPYSKLFHPKNMKGATFIVGGK